MIELEIFNVFFLHPNDLISFVFWGIWCLNSFSQTMPLASDTIRINNYIVALSQLADLKKKIKKLTFRCIMSLGFLFECVISDGHIMPDHLFNAFAPFGTPFLRGFTIFNALRVNRRKATYVYLESRLINWIGMWQSLCIGLVAETKRMS